MMGYKNTCAIVICHGQTEYKFASSVVSILKLNIKVWGRNKGRSSIQIHKSLKDVLNNEIFSTRKKLVKKWPTIEYRRNNTELKDFKIFTLMDVDDCDDKSVINNYKNNHISGIGDHQLKPYIQTIYCLNNFEDALRDINFPFVAKNDRQKHKYIDVFDPVKGELQTKQSIEKLCNLFNKSNKTNLDLFLEYCLNHSRTDK